jgi:hypothetical protein
LIEGEWPADGIVFENPASLNAPGAVIPITRLVVSPDEQNKPTAIDRSVIYGTDWDQAYEMFRPELVGVVVLGGGPICLAEAITSHTLGKGVWTIDPKILPQEHRPGKPSASVRLVTEFGYQALDARGISEAIKAAVNRAE